MLPFRADCPAAGNRAMTTSRITWGETRRRLAGDGVRIRAMLRARFGAEPRFLLFDSSWRCVLLHRLAHYFWRRDARRTARLFMQLNSLVTGADIHPNCDFGGGLLIPHPAGLIASGNAGRNLTMMPLAGIGIMPSAEDVGAGPGLPVLGDDVWLGASCGVLGPLHVGSGSRLQPGSPLTRDVPYISEDTGTVNPGMTEREVYLIWAAPAAVRRVGVYTYLFFQNGCEYTCGTMDVVTLQNGRVVDAIVRWDGHRYSGESSSPPGRVPFANPGGEQLQVAPPPPPQPPPPPPSTTPAGA